MLKQAFSLKKNFSYLITPPPQHEAVVDGIRAIAILLVIAMHLISATQLHVSDAAAQFAALPVWLKWPMHGFLGVDMFFVISGFLIGGILFREYKRYQNIRLGNFFARRFMRLMPLYWVALVVSALVVAAGGQESMQMVNVTMYPNIDEIWKNFLYINNFFRISDQFSAMSHSWSLAVEEQFYFLFPLLLLLFFGTRLRKHPGKVVIVLTLSYLVIRFISRIYAVTLFETECGYSQEELQNLEINILTMMSSEKLYCLFGVENDVMLDNLYTKYFALFAGVIGAYMKVFREQRLVSFYASKIKSNLLGLLSVGIIVFDLCYVFFIARDHIFNLLYQSFFQQIAFSIAVCNLILVGIYGKGIVVTWIRAFLGARIFYVIAQMAYSMYLFNLLVVRLTYHFALQLVGSGSLTTLVGVAIPILIPITLLVSVLAYLFIERPFMNMRSMLKKRQAPGKPAATATTPAIEPS